MPRARVGWGAQPPQRRHEGNQQAFYLQLSLLGLLPSLGSRSNYTLKGKINFSSNYMFWVDNVYWTWGGKITSQWLLFGYTTLFRLIGDVHFMMTFETPHSIQEAASTCCLIKPHAMAQAGAVIEVLNLICCCNIHPLWLENLMCWTLNYSVMNEGTPRGRLQLAWHGHQPTDLPPGRRVPRSVQVAQFGLKILEEEIGIIRQRSCWWMGWKCDAPQQWSMSGSSGFNFNS